MSNHTDSCYHSKQRLEVDEENDEDSNTELKTWQVYSFGKRNVLIFDLKEYCQEKVSVGEEGEGHSMY